MDRFEEVGMYLCLEGTAKNRGMKNLCKKKLCLYSSDRQFMLDLLHELSQANDCFEVKLRRNDRNSICFGQCYFTNESAVGDAWAQYESHPKVWVAIHDDEFTGFYKPNIRTY